MKRSFINQQIDQAQQFLDSFQVHLPEFAYFTAQDWRSKDKQRWREVLDLQLGWDMTDFGRGDFNHCGLGLFTLRNGSLSDERYRKTYAEKMLLVGVDQETPWHFHFSKMEDIINRGGGELCIQVAHASADQQLDTERPVQLTVDGCLRTVSQGETLRLNPGQGICLEPYIYHRFWAEKSPVLGWEVSMVNDDSNDNRFLEPLSRFAAIDEDVAPEWLLCNEYHLIKE